MSETSDHPNPTPLVMLHGWGMNNAVWSTTPAATWGTHPRQLLALPGHGGETPVMTAGDPLWSWADHALARAPARAIWLGWSLGGLLALAAALRAPERVAGLILIAATPRFVQAKDWTPAIPEATLEAFHADLDADPDGTLARFLALQMRGAEHAREDLRNLRHALAQAPDNDPAALATGLEILRDADLRGRLVDIACPALWLFGARDTLTPPAVGERVELLMPGASVATIEDAAHAPQLSHPAPVQETIAAFLGQIDTAAASDRT